MSDAPVQTIQVCRYCNLTAVEVADLAARGYESCPINDEVGHVMVEAPSVSRQVEDVVADYFTFDAARRWMEGANAH